MTRRSWTASATMLAVLTIGGMLIGAAPANGVRVGTGSIVQDSNGDLCVAASFDNASSDVFGAPVNLGTDVAGMFCNGHFDTMTGGTGHCVSVPDNSKLAFDWQSPPSPNGEVGIPQAFVGSVSNATGSVATAIGAVTYTFDGIQTLQPDPNNPQQPEILPQNDIPGCLVSGPVSVLLGNVSLNAFQPVSTSTGTNVNVSSTASYANPDTGAQLSVAVDVTFANVSSGGNTVVTATSSAAGDLTSSFAVNVGGLIPTYFDISTDATVSGPITVCQHYSDADNDGFVDGTGVAETDLRLLHGEGTPVVYVDRTVQPIDTVNNVICAQVSSLSPFVVAVATGGITPSTHDSVVLPVKPVKASISASKAEVIKTVSIKVRNADLNETAGHQIQLRASSTSCPATVLTDDSGTPVQPNFAASHSPPTDTKLVPGGATATATLPLRLVARDFNTPNAKSAARCAIDIVATSLPTATVVESNSSNNRITVELDVIDKHDF